MAYRIPNKHPLDINQRVGVGVSIPFNGPAVFNTTYTTSEQIKSNIINYVLTNNNERVFNPNFGANLRAQLFENVTPISVSNLENNLIRDINTLFPNVKVLSINIQPLYDENIVNISITYSILNNTPEIINISI
jgi:phage baseplate assembly protein W